MTRLADFIQANREPILREWEAFARTCSPASGSMNVAALRDHADQMLTAIAADLRTPQGRRAQREKSQGQAITETGEATAAEEHGSGRAESGFTVEHHLHRLSAAPRPTERGERACPRGLVPSSHSAAHAWCSGRRARLPRTADGRWPDPPLHFFMGISVNASEVM